VKSHDSVRDFGALWFEAEIAEKSKSYSTVTRRALDKHVYPAIGNKPLADVNAGDVLAICDKIKERGAPQMALLTRNVIKRMYEYAIAR
jgi:integrase